MDYNKNRRMREKLSYMIHGEFNRLSKEERGGGGKNHSGKQVCFFKHLPGWGTPPRHPAS